jgi:hypothetical protein
MPFAKHKKPLYSAHGFFCSRRLHITIFLIFLLKFGNSTFVPYSLLVAISAQLRTSSAIGFTQSTHVLWNLLQVLIGIKYGLECLVLAKDQAWFFSQKIKIKLWYLHNSPGSPESQSNMVTCYKINIQRITAL